VPTPSPDHRARCLLLAAAALLLAGCPSVASYQSADPLPPGHWELGASTEVLRVRDLPQDTASPALQMALLARRGLVEDLDAGLKLFTYGLEGSVRWRLLAGDWRVALAPNLSAARTQEGELVTESLHLFAQLPLLITHDLGTWATLTLAPRALWGLYYPTTGGSAQGWMLGTSATLELPLASGRFALIPELAALRTVSGDVPVDGTWVQAGVGFVWRTR